MRMFESEKSISTPCAVISMLGPTWRSNINAGRRLAVWKKPLKYSVHGLTVQSLGVSLGHKCQSDHSNWGDSI